MADKQSGSSRYPYLQGLVAGLVSAAVLAYLLNMTGFLVVSAGNSMSIVSFLNWSYKNLGLSVIPFALTLVLYAFYLKRLEKELEQQCPQAETVAALEQKIDLLMNIFFGIGVIWTAIGMRNALLASLGNMDAETAARKGAFYILTNLVDGGILLALSTTIFGGIGGYVMRMAKAWVVGTKLELFFSQRHLKDQENILDGLDRIASLLQKSSTPEPAVLEKGCLS